MEHDLLRVQNISKYYGSRKVLDNISINIKQGEIVGVIGGSGGGKTTLLSTLIGFIQADDGDIKFRQRNLVAGAEDGEEIYRSVFKKKHQFKASYGFASQVPSFYEKLTVLENLHYFGQLYGLTQESIKANARTLLKLMDLELSANALAKNLSGGMERRLDIACALIHNPEMLILDEPTADLDPILRKNIYDLLKRINKKGTTIVLASHHLNELETLCTRIAMLKQGAVAEIGSPQEIKEKYLKSHEIIVETYPGNYAVLEKKVKKKFKKKIEEVGFTDSSITIRTEKPQLILNDIIQLIEKEEEKILELKLVKPSLDQVFISMNH